MADVGMHDDGGFPASSLFLPIIDFENKEVSLLVDITLFYAC